MPDATRSRLCPWRPAAAPARGSPQPPVPTSPLPHFADGDADTLPRLPAAPSSPAPARSPEGGDMQRGGFQMAVISRQQGLDTCQASSHLPPPRLPTHFCTSRLARGFSARGWTSCSGVGGAVSAPHSWPEFPTPKHRQVPKTRPVAAPASCRGLARQITLAHFLGLCEAWRCPGVGSSQRGVAGRGLGRWRPEHCGRSQQAGCPRERARET